MSPIRQASLQGLCNKPPHIFLKGSYWYKIPVSSAQRHPPAAASPVGLPGITDVVAALTVAASTKQTTFPRRVWVTPVVSKASEAVR